MGWGVKEDKITDWDCISNKMPKCPHCGHDWECDNDLLHMANHNNIVVTGCPKCGEDMQIEIEYEVTYTTTIHDPQRNDQ